MRFAFAGDRALAVQVLKFILAQGHQPCGLLIGEPGRASHGQELIGLVSQLPDDLVITGDRLEHPDTLARLRGLDLDLIICIHYPYVIRPALLHLPRWGVVNLHPAFLPYNRGWHTPSWAILDGTPYGATLHLMSEQLDAGDIVHQRTLDIRPEDTADTLYARVLALELEVFREAWPCLLDGVRRRTPQVPGQGTSHRKQDLFAPAVAHIDLDAPTTAAVLIDRLRALTTNHIDEAAWFERNGHRYRVQVRITKAAAEDP